jgi:hypothetical protein
MIKKTIPYKLTTNARQSEGELVAGQAYDVGHQVLAQVSRSARLMREEGGPFLFGEGRQGRKMLSS